MLPYVLEAVDAANGLGIPANIKWSILSFLAEHPDTLWKRPLIMLSEQ